MSIDQFTRDAAYFQSRRDSGMLLNAEDLDFQFNNLIDYLNTKIVPMINSFVQKEFIGVNNPALADSCLLNIGDGNVRWEKINSNIFPDYSIPLSKFASVSPNCIIWAGNNGIFGYNTVSNLNDGILFSRNNITPVWRKVATGDIANKTLIGGHIALQAIELEHLSVHLQQELMSLPSLILNASLIDKVIIESHFEDNSIFYEKLSKDILDARAKAINESRYTWVDNSIENRHIAPDTLIGGYGLKSVPYDYLGNYNKYMCVQMRPYQYVDDNVNYTFTSDNILNESITADLIDTDPEWRIKQNHFAYGAIEPRHIQDGSLFFGGYLNGFPNEQKIPASALDPVIRKKLGV